MSLKGKKIKSILRTFQKYYFFPKGMWQSTFCAQCSSKINVAHIRKADIISKHSKKHQLTVRSCSFQHINEETSKNRILLKSELMQRSDDWTSQSYFQLFEQHLRVNLHFIQTILAKGFATGTNQNSTSHH